MSAFICETTHLARGSGFAQALGYLVATVAGCAAVFFAGFQAVRWILKI
jgi:fluoride ion exporter CrcB/FEX